MLDVKMYADSYDGQFCAGDYNGTWVDHMQAAGFGDHCNVYQCPAWPKPEDEADGKKSYGHHRFTWKLNFNPFPAGVYDADGYSGSQTWNVPKIQNAEKFDAFMDTVKASGGVTAGCEFKHYTPETKSSAGVQNRHLEKANAAFLDGHVETVPTTRFRTFGFLPIKKYYDRKRVLHTSPQ